jgi:peptidoglycan/LPS O-acetylase OafA/YrhL
MPRKIPQLDGVRGVAILLVLVHNLHGFYTLPFSYLTAYGWMGVDLFFVLSGFLITGVLLDSKSSGTYFRDFYARRCLRIWPLYYGVLLLMFGVLPLLTPQNATEIFHRSHPWWSYPFFLQNFLVADPSAAVGPLGVSWSLAVEELFYVFWPFFVRFVPLRLLGVGACFVCVLSPVLRLYFVSHDWLIYSNPFCRLDGLMAGGLLAILVRKPDFQPGRLVPAAWIGLILGGPLAIVSEVHQQRWLTFSLAVLASVGFVYLAQFSQWAWIRAVLTNRFLIFSGTISYGLYLLHKLPEDGLKFRGYVWGHPRASFWISLASAYLIAAASWFLLEKPILRLKRYFEHPHVEHEGTSATISTIRPAVSD